MVAIVLFTSLGWNRSAEPVEDRLSLRTMSLFVPALVLVQIALGAAYRNQAMGVLTPHFWGPRCCPFLLLVGVLVVKHYPGHRSLEPAAVALMSITGVQVLLGFATFLALLMSNQATPPVVVSTVAHVATGALTLAASVVLAIQIRRNVHAAQPNWASRVRKPGRPESGDLLYRRFPIPDQPAHTDHTDPQDQRERSG
jgi:heme A synthase